MGILLKQQYKKRNNMFKSYPNKYNLYHKLSAAVIIIFSLLFTITILIVNTLIDSVSQERLEVLKNHYGSYHFIFHNVGKDDIDFISSDSFLDRYGLLIHSGSYVITDSDYTLSLGYYDEEALKLGRIEVISGRLPEKDDEICIESLYLDLFDDKKEIGDNIELSIENEKISFVISGILKDYHGYWRNTDIISPGKTDYPGALISEDRARSMKLSESVLTLYKGVRNSGQYSSIVRHVTNEYYFEDIVFNEEVYDSGYWMLCKPLNEYRAVFISVFFVLGTYLLFVIFKLHLSSFSEESMLFKGIGKTNRGITMDCIAIILSPFSIGTMVALAMYISFFSLFQEGQFLRYITDCLIYALIPILSCLVAMNFILFLFIHKKDKQKERREYYFTADYKMELYSVFTKKKMLKVAALLMIIAVLISIFFCIDYDKKYRLMTLMPPKDYYRLYADRVSGCATIYVGAFEIDSAPLYFGYDSTYKLTKKLEGYGARLNYSFSGDRRLIMPETDSEYWTEVEAKSTYHPFVGTRYHIETKNIPSIPKDIMASDYFGTFTVRENNRDRFHKLYPEIDLEKDLAPGKVVMFFEPLRESFTGEGETYEDYYNEGDTIKLASLRYTDVYDKDHLDPEKIEYLEDELEITKIYRKDFRYKDDYQETGGYGMPILVYTEETANMCRCIKGIEYIDCYIPKTIDDNTYEEIVREFNKVALSVDSAFITESRFQEDFYQEFYRMIDLSFVIIVILAVLSLSYAVYSLITIDLKYTRFNTSVLRTFGIGKKPLLLMKIMEYVTYILTGFVMTMIMSLVSVYVFSKNVYIITTKDIVYYAAIVCGIYGAFLIASWIAAYISTDRQMKTNISEAIRNDE